VSIRVSIATGAVTPVSYSKCTPTPRSDPLSNPEFDCGGVFANGLRFFRLLSSVKFGVCSIGVLNDCNCLDTSFASNDIYIYVFFSGNLIASTLINILLNANAIEIQTYISSLTDS
jgi:hypothetical protein